MATKKTYRVILAVVGLFIAGDGVSQSSLDRPIEAKKPTVRSEIFRGQKATEDCVGIHSPLRFAPLDYAACIANIENRNVQSGTSNDAFLAGLHFGAWLSMAITDKVLRERGQQPADDRARAFFVTMKSRQKTLRLDDRSLCGATEVRCDYVVPIMQQWE